MNFSHSPVSILLFLITIGISLYAFYGKTNILETWLLNPFYVFRYKKFDLLVKSGFIHIDLPHLIFNMMSFYFFGFLLEQVLRYHSGSAISGSLMFFFIYMGSMVIGNIPDVIKNRNDYNFRSAGASGAISGILFSFILFEPTAKISFFFIPIGIPAWIFGIIYLAYCVFAAKQSYDNVNHMAHFYGAIGGVVLTIIFMPQTLAMLF